MKQFLLLIIIFIFSLSPVAAEEENLSSVIKNRLSEKPFGYQERPLGLKETPFGYVDTHSGFREKHMNTIEESEDLRATPPNFIEKDKHPLVNEDQDLRIGTEVHPSANNNTSLKISLDQHPSAKKTDIKTES